MDTPMDVRIDRETVVERLRENDLDYTILELNSAASVIVTTAGGRILGPFRQDDGESLFWINPAFRNGASWAAFRSEGGWNIGGERLWIAPEIQFSIRDRDDIPGSYQLPRAMDPGFYTLTRPSGERVDLTAEMDLEAFNLAAGRIALSVHRSIEAAANPLRRLRDAEELMTDVVYFGYRHRMRLRLREPSAIIAETWNLIQLRQGGVVMVPLPLDADIGWYWKPDRAGAIQAFDTLSTIPFTQGNRFKMGFRAAQCNGTAAYLLGSGSGRFSLIIRRFFINPSATYSEEPFFVPGDRGYALHLFNSGDAREAFGEIECNGQAIGGRTGRAESDDVMLLWVFQGSPSSLKEILLHLTGVSRTVLNEIWPDITRKAAPPGAATTASDGNDDARGG